MPVCKFFLAQLCVLILQFIAHGNCQTVHGTNFFYLKLFHLTTQHFFGLGHLTCHFTVSHKTNSSTFAYSTCNQVCEFCITSIFIFQELTYKGPATWSSECTTSTLWIKIKQCLFCERNVTHNVLMNVVFNCPLEPTIKVFGNFQVYKTISQWARHSVTYTLVAFAITCGNNNYIVWKHILTNTSVKNKLITCGLHTGRRTIHFIQEQYYNGILTCKFCVRQINWGSPIHFLVVLVKERNTANVCGLHLAQTQVNHMTTKFCSQICNNFALTNAWRAP